MRGGSGGCERVMEQHDRQCTYNATLGRVLVTIIAVEKQYVQHMYYECVFVALLIQRARRYVPYSLLLPVWLYRIFSHCLTKARFFLKVILHKMCVSIFSAISVRNISHSKKKRAKYDHKCMSVSK